MALSPRLIVRMPAPAMRGAGTVNIDINAKWLDSVRFVATSGTLSSIDAGQVIDGVTVVAGDTFLFQPLTAGVATTAVANGIYVAGADGVVPVRRSDADSGAEIFQAAVAVREGTSGAGQQWINVNAAAPAVGTDGICFRLMSAGSGGGGAAATSTLRASADFATYSDQADIVVTGGYNVYSDAGGMVWKRGTATIPTTLTYFRRQDAGGTWYEAISKRTILGETVGIFGAGAGVDIGPAITDVATWLDGKGGGRLVLPPGICAVNTDARIDTSGFWLQGTAQGDSSFNQGTILRCAAGKTIRIGGDVATGGVEQYQNTFSDMAVLTEAGSTSYVFTSLKQRGLYFQNIYVRGVYGFLNAGDLVAGNQTKQAFFHNIEGSLSAAPGHFILGRQFGIFFMTNVSIAGAPTAADVTPGCSFINIPSNALTSPDGVSITNCSTEDFDVGLNIRGGAGNWYVSNTWFDGCRTTGIDLRGANSISAMHFSNVHIAGHPPPDGLASSVGLRMAGASDASISRCSFSGGEIVHMGGQAVMIGVFTDDISITGNQFVDNAWFTDNTLPVVEIETGANNIHVTDNQIYKKTTGTYPNRPRHGILVESAELSVTVANNSIKDVDTATISNTNRGPASTRKVHGNSGQVLEGQVVVVGPWVVQNLEAGQTDLALMLSSPPSVPTAVILRRGQVLSIAGRASGVVTSAAGSVTFEVFKNSVGVGANLQATTTAASQSQCFKEYLDGVDFAAGDTLGVRVTTTAGYLPVTLEWAIFLHIIYD